MTPALNFKRVRERSCQAPWNDVREQIDEQVSFLVNTRADDLYDQIDTQINEQMIWMIMEEE